MKNFIINNILLITAIISLIGVSFAAIMSYCSNVKVNNSKIQHEKNTIRQTFLKESLQKLIIASQELRDMDAKLNSKNPLSDVMDNNIKAIEIYHQINYCLPKEKRNILEGLRENIDSCHSEI